MGARAMWYRMAGSASRCDAAVVCTSCHSYRSRFTPDATPVHLSSLLTICTHVRTHTHSPARLHNGQALLFDASRDRRHAAAKAARAGVSGGPGGGGPPPGAGLGPESEEELGSIFHGLFGG